MNKARNFWIPRSAPEHLQLALSIPGDPPSTVHEHWNRLESHLARLARELEEDLDRRQVFETVYELVPDSNIFLLTLDHTVTDLIYAVMESDLVRGAKLTDEEDLGPGIADEELQESAREYGLEDRLSALTNPYRDDEILDNSEP